MQFLKDSTSLNLCYVAFISAIVKLDLRDGAGIEYVNQLCLKQGDQVILNLVFILEIVNH